MKIVKQLKQSMLIKNIKTKIIYIKTTKTELLKWLNK